MTKIKVSILAHDNGGTAPVPNGSVRFAPVRRHITGNNVFAAKSFTANLDANGTVTVDLTPTDDTWAWHATELPGTPYAYDRYFEVPDSTTQLEYTSLTDINPTTLIPVEMDGSTLLRVYRAANQQDAETYSAAHPNVLVFYDETPAATIATDALAAIAQAAADAQTKTRQITALKATAESNADTVNTLSGEAKANVRAITHQAQTVADSAQDAITRIDKAVKTVEDAAQNATGNNNEDGAL